MSSRSLKSRIANEVCDEVRENLNNVQLVENNSRIFVDVVRVSVSVIRRLKRIGINLAMIFLALTRGDEMYGEIPQSVMRD